MGFLFVYAAAGDYNTVAFLYNFGQFAEFGQNSKKGANLDLLFDKGGEAVERFLTTPQFAKCVGVSKNTIINWERQGLILPHHVSPTGRRFYSMKQVEDVLSGTAEGVVAAPVEDSETAGSETALCGQEEITDSGGASPPAEETSG